MPRDQAQGTAPARLPGPRTGPGGRRRRRSRRPAAGRAHPGQPDRGRARIGAGDRRPLCARLRPDRDFLACRVHRSNTDLRLWVRRRARPAPPSRRRARAAQIRVEPGRRRRSRRVLPFWFALVLPDDLRVLLVFRIVRFFKIARYSPAMRSLLDVLYRERRALFGCLVITLGTALVAAALMHLAEAQAAAGQARHHSRRALVGDRHHRHHWLRRRGADHRARQVRSPPALSSPA